MIWVVGFKGMLATELCERLDEAGLPWIGSDRDVDIRSYGDLEAFAAGKGIGWIVNCAAYTAVDKAESEPELAAALNETGAGNLARLAEALGARFIQISTDYVFRGDGSRPLTEADPTDPVGVYASTKAAGERAVLSSCSRAYVVRTAWLYGRNGPNFIATMLRLMAANDTVRVVADQRGTPTNARDVAEFLVGVIRSGIDAFGIYHYTGGGETSWHGFAEVIRDEALAVGLLSRGCAVEAITTAEYPTAAPRPAYSVLSKDKARRVFGAEPSPWRESLRRYLAETVASK